MGLINKMISGGGQLAERLEPSFRFGGFERMGAHTREADTRSVKQLLANIDYFAEKNPEVAQFKKELKSMNPEHLGLASDICELANRTEMLSQSINLKQLRSNDGKSLFAYLMEQLPKASKENPKALDFTKEVINQTDMTASKYFLADFGKIMEHPEAAEHLAAAKPMVKDIAEQTLGGGYLMDFVKEKSFMNFIKTLVHPESKPEKIAMLPKVVNAIDKNLQGNSEIYLDSFVRSNTPIPQIEANLPQIKIASNEAQKQGKSFNVIDFLTTNVNFAKAQPKVNIDAVKAGKFTLV